MITPEAMREKLIEQISQAIQNVPMVHTGTINVQGAIVADKRPPSVRIADAVLKAIESQGLAILPVVPNQALERAFEYASYAPWEAYDQFIKAGRL